MRSAATSVSHKDIHENMVGILGENAHSYNIVNLWNAYHHNGRWRVSEHYTATEMVSSRTASKQPSTTTNFICSRKERERERERERGALFNDALNTFYQGLFGVRHMVKDHSDSEKGNPLPPHRLLLSINSKGYFICTIPQTGLTHTTAFVAPVVEHCLE